MIRDAPHSLWGHRAMITDDELPGIVCDLIARRSEGVYWDFKRKHHVNCGDLIHDVLCLANADHDGPRFLIFGVEDGGKAVPGIEGDTGRKTQAKIADLFRANAGRFFQSRFPTFQLRTIGIKGKPVDVLVIENEPRKPYYLVEQIQKVKPHHIYSRVCDTNTPVKDSAQPHEIERMWRERFGLGVTALERARRCLADPCAWTIREEDGFDVCHHDVLPEFTLKTTSSGEERIDSSQEWTRGEIVTDDHHAGWYEIRCHQTLLRRIHYVVFDNGQKDMVAPSWRPIGRGRFYFYTASSIEYAVHRFWTSRQGRDDSNGLRIRGTTSAATEARSRWPHGLDIPVLNALEMREFLEGRRVNSIHGDPPTSDRNEQYELFLRNLLDFDTWRRDRRRE